MASTVAELERRMTDIERLVRNGVFIRADYFEARTETLRMEIRGCNDAIQKIEETMKASGQAIRNLLYTTIASVMAAMIVFFVTNGGA